MCWNHHGGESRAKPINPRGTDYTALDHAPIDSEARYQWIQIYQFVNQPRVYDGYPSINPSVADWGTDDTLETIARKCAAIRIADADSKHFVEGS